MVRVYSSQQRVESGGGQRLLLASNALHFVYPGVGIEVGYGEKLVAGLFDPVFHLQPVEQRVLGLLLGGGNFYGAANEIASDRKSEQFHFSSGKPTVAHLRLPFITPLADEKI